MNCVSLIFTDYGVFECAEERFVVRQLAANISEDDVRSTVGAAVEFAREPAARR